MTGDEHSRVMSYLRRVRRGLVGLPPADRDDIVEELRTHLFEEIGEQRDAAAALDAFGDAATVAAEIVERRVRPDGDAAVREASPARRYAAWATDVVVGFGPLILVPTLLGSVGPALGQFGDRETLPIWLLLAEKATTALQWGSVAESDLTIPGWQWLMLAALVAWAGSYWFVARRARSASAGMWMAGLRAVRVDGDRRVIRERDIAAEPTPERMAARRWWILLGAIPAGCLCILLTLLYLGAVIGMFTDAQLDPTSAAHTVPSLPDIEEDDRRLAVLFDLERALALDDHEAARDLCAPQAQEDLDRLFARRAQPDWERPGAQSRPGWYALVDSAQVDGRMLWRETEVVIDKQVRQNGHTYEESYLITDIVFGEFEAP